MQTKKIKEKIREVKKKVKNFISKDEVIPHMIF